MNYLFLRGSMRGMLCLILALLLASCGKQEREDLAPPRTPFTDSPKNCPNCGFQNEPADRYCLECGGEVRTLSPEERKQITLQNEDRQKDMVESAKRHYNAARAERGKPSALEFYRQAKYHAEAALNLGEKSLNASDRKTMHAILDETRREIPGLVSMARSISQGEVMIPLEGSSNAYYVQVRLNDTVNTRLHVDTGASMVFLPRATAAAAGHTQGRPMQVIVADGRTVPAIQFFLRKITVGPITLENIPASSPLSEEGPTAGLLGMSFLKHFHATIDHDRKVLILKPRK